MGFIWLMLSKIRSILTLAVHIPILWPLRSSHLIQLLTWTVLVAPGWTLSEVMAQSYAGASVSNAVRSAGLLNDWLREQSTLFDPFDIGGQIRGRLENKQFFAVANEGHADFQKLGDSDNTFF